MKPLFILVTLIVGLSTCVALGKSISGSQRISESAQITPTSDVEAEYQREKAKYYVALQELNIKVFDQKRYTGWVILILVTIITAGGFAFSLFLILKASQQRGHQPVSDLEVTLQKIRLTSIQTASLVGLTVYLASLGFLYLYMQMTYTIDVKPSSSPTIMFSPATQSAPLDVTGTSRSSP